MGRPLTATPRPVEAPLPRRRPLAGLAIGVAGLWLLAAVLIPRLAARSDLAARREMRAVLQTLAVAQQAYAADHDLVAAPALSMLPAGTVPIGAVTVDLTTDGATWRAVATSTRTTTRCVLAGDVRVPIDAARTAEARCGTPEVVNTAGVVRYAPPIGQAP